jgi:hypothetical protein
MWPGQSLASKAPEGVCAAGVEKKLAESSELEDTSDGMGWVLDTQSALPIEEVPAGAQQR